MRRRVLLASLVATTMMGLALAGSAHGDRVSLWGQTNTLTLGITMDAPPPPWAQHRPPPWAPERERHEAHGHGHDTARD